MYARQSFISDLLIPLLNLVNTIVTCDLLNHVNSVVTSELLNNVNTIVTYDLRNHMNTIVRRIYTVYISSLSLPGVTTGLITINSSQGLIMMRHRRRGFWPGWDIHPISAECRASFAGHSPALNHYLIDVSRCLTESRPVTKPVYSGLLDIVSFRASLESSISEMLQGHGDSQICGGAGVSLS